MKKILIVEDDLPLLRMYQVAFKRSGLEVLNAVNGEEALKIAREQKPDLILLDLVIPKKSGFDVLKELKEDPNFKETPIACLSVLHQDEDIKKCMDLGAYDFYVKTSVLPDQVVSKVVAKLA